MDIRWRNDPAAEIEGQSNSASLDQRSDWNSLHSRLWNWGVPQSGEWGIGEIEISPVVTFGEVN
jgi:hypothetical protein